MSSGFNKQQTPFCPNPTRAGGFWLGGIISGTYALCYLSQLFFETGGIINLFYTRDTELSGNIPKVTQLQSDVRIRFQV